MEGHAADPEDHAVGLELQLIELVEQQARARVQGRGDLVHAAQREIDAALGRGRPGEPGLVAKAELDGVRLIASLTFDGNGPAILPATAVPEYLRDQWVRVAIHGLPRRRVGVVTRRRGLLSAPARAVGELLVEIVAAQVGAAGDSGVYPPADADG